MVRLRGGEFGEFGWGFASIGYSIGMGIDALAIPTIDLTRIWITPMSEGDSNGR
jgi:hypothetical protein